MIGQKFKRLVASVGLAATIVAQGAMPARADDTIKIGVALELSGRFVSFGAYCRDGIVFSCAPFAELREQRLRFMPLYFAGSLNQLV